MVAHQPPVRFNQFALFDGSVPLVDFLRDLLGIHARFGTPSHGFDDLLARDVVTERHSDEIGYLAGRARSFGYVCQVPFLP